MTGRALPELPGCGRAASARFELYADAAYSSLDGSLHLCDDHADAYALRKATGLVPYRVTMSGLKRCGDGWDFLAGGPLNAPERVRRFDTEAGRWRWWLVDAGQWADDEYQIVTRETADDTVVDVVRDGAVLLTWTFGEACEVAQQLADWFGTFTGPSSRMDGGEQTGERCPIHKVPMAYVGCDWPYWFCPVSGDPGHGSWVPEHDCPGGAR